MALKKFDVPDIDEAISEAKSEELRKHEAETAEKISAAIQIFVKKSPEIIKAMNVIVSCLDTQRFTSDLDKELRKSATGMAQLFNERVKPMVDRVEKTDRRISIPTVFAYVVFISILFLFAFFALVIYANTRIQSELLSGLTIRIVGLWILSVAVTVYFTRKFKW